MTGVVARFDDSAIRRHLARLAIADAGGFAELRVQIGEYMLGDVQDNLDDQMLFDGAPMPQSKAAIARDGKTLIDKRNAGLYGSYNYQLSRDGVEIGSALIYAAIHHFGGETGRGHKVELPARPVLGVGPKQERRLGDLIVREIERLQ